MKRLLTVLLSMLWMVLVPFQASALSLTWTVPEGLSAPETVLEQEEEGTVFLLMDNAGSLYRLTAADAAVSGLDFDSMGRKKLTILVQQLIKGRSGSLIRLTLPERTPEDLGHRCKWWILLEPTEQEPAMCLLFTACRGVELTLQITVGDSQQIDNALSRTVELAASLLLKEE